MRKTGGTYQPTDRTTASSEQHIAISDVEGAIKQGGSEKTGPYSEENRSEDVLESIVVILNSLDEWQESREDKAS